MALTSIRHPCSVDQSTSPARMPISFIIILSFILCLYRLTMAEHQALAAANSSHLATISNPQNGHTRINKTDNNSTLSTQSTDSLPTVPYIHIATVDSGFGGFFTTKAIEASAHQMQKKFGANFTLTHYGDTLNAPYGEKSPEDIANLGAQLIKKSDRDGANYIFIACNTISSQYDAIKKILQSSATSSDVPAKTFSIIEVSIHELHQQIQNILKHKNHVTVAILATPATIKSDLYPLQLQQSFQINHPLKSQLQTWQVPRWYQLKSKVTENAFSSLEFKISKNKTVELYQFAPGNWVELIEHQANTDEQNKWLSQDFSDLSRHLNNKTQFDIVAEFCTHFPVFDQKIKSALQHARHAHKNTSYIQQGKLFAHLFEQLIEQQFTDKKRLQNLATDKSNISAPSVTLSTQPIMSPRIFISGANKTETENLVKTIFPEQKNPEVIITPFH